VYTKPQLEIYADDVRCTHGATTGQLDEEAGFYLRARGIDPARARLLLIESFVGEALDRIPNEQVREIARRDVLEKVAAAITGS